MPLYLDVHNKVDGLSTQMAAEAHKKDLAVQGKYGVNYLRYWYDEGTGKVFCLVEAPSKEAAAAVHREAHGLVADEIIEVKEGSYPARRDAGSDVVPAVRTPESASRQVL